MDVAYDHVQEGILPEHKERQEEDQSSSQPASNDFKTELSQTYQAFTQSTWGVKLGGLWASARKQGETYYTGARQELSQASDVASKGVNDLITGTGALTIASTEGNKESPTQKHEQNPTEDRAAPESLTADIAREARSMFASFRSGAGARLKQVQAAEDAADEALLRFGSNIRDFLRDAVQVTGPEDASDKGEILFESRDPEGKRVVHATRFDAQLHVIHSTSASFIQDPLSDEFSKWKADFNVEQKTEAIATDLNKYPELRRSMEKLVPEKVEYASFWTRYYFLRHIVESEEQKRRDLLRSAQAEEEISWDDDEEDEEEKARTPHKNPSPKAGGDGQTTPTNAGSASSADLLKPAEGRRSNENSVADSDTSYDIVSGATSRAPGSPKEDKLTEQKPGTVAEESDEDWE